MKLKPHTTIPPTVPVSYVLLMLDIATDHGLDRARLIEEHRLSSDVLQRPDGRIDLLEEYMPLCRRLLHLTGEPALAYEFGLRATLTTHGIFGYGLMSQPTLGHVFRFANRYSSVLRMPAWNIRFVTEAPYAVMEARESVSHGALRNFSCEQLLVGTWSIVRGLLPQQCSGLELLFDFPEPAYYARYRDRMPICHFGTDVTQMRVPIDYLDIPLQTADSGSATFAEQVCERELNLLGHSRDVVNQVRAALMHTPDGYPTLHTVAQRLFLSSRTLERQLSERGSSFRRLLSEAQNRDSQALLLEPHLTLSDVAQRLGYSSLANFARAFRAWNGRSPSEYRARNLKDSKIAPRARRLRR
ncbi:MAG TPA: AraC family transcriptional regulator ligand-binding domain-containing protein [Solimonas sp.]